jgi:hypothetical protein
MRWLIGTCLDSVAVKKAYWENCVRHFCGDHSDCPFAHENEIPVWDGAAHKVCVDTLTLLVQKTKPILGLVVSDYSTQINESLNRTKVKYANKDVCWGFTWKARMACAILDRNDPGWKLALYEKLKLPPLSPEALMYLQQTEEKRLRDKLWYNSVEYREMREKERRSKKQERKKRKKQLFRNELDYKQKPKKPKKSDIDREKTEIFLARIRKRISAKAYEEDNERGPK